MEEKRIYLSCISQSQAVKIIKMYIFIVLSAKKTEKPLYVFIKNLGSTMPFWNSLMGMKTSFASNQNIAQSDIKISSLHDEEELSLNATSLSTDSVNLHFWKLNTYFNAVMAAIDISRIFFP